MKPFLTTICLLTVILVSASLAAGQTSAASGQYDQYLSLLRKDLRSGKKQLVAANITLTEAEAVKFWPVYDRYAAETEKLNNERVAIIKDYAKNFDNLNDAQAASLNKRAIAVDNAMTSLRLKYVPLFAKTVGGITLARFFQIDKRLALLIDLQIASEIPIVEP